MKKEKEYQEIESFYKKEIKDRIGYKKEMLSTFEKAKKWGWSDEDLDSIHEIIYCVDHFYKIHKDDLPVFLEIIRRHIVDIAGFINHNSEPTAVINSIEDASFFSDLYYYYH